MFSLEKERRIKTLQARSTVKYLLSAHPLWSVGVGICFVSTGFRSRLAYSSVSLFRYFFENLRQFILANNNRTWVKHYYYFSSRTISFFEVINYFLFFLFKSAVLFFCHCSMFCVIQITIFILISTYSEYIPIILKYNRLFTNMV